MSKPEQPPARAPSIVRRRSALIIAGAAAKGPFAAGALAELSATQRFDLAAVVGASSGALNGAVYAAGLRVGRAGEAAELLCDLWATRASVTRILTLKQRIAIVREALERFRGYPTTTSAKSPLRFHVVVASLVGHKEPGHEHVLSEQAFHFEAEDFRSAERLDLMARVCVASGAIPFVFYPVSLDGSQYWDGGVVNNTPISLAIHGDKERGNRPTDVNHLIIVSPVRNVTRPGNYGRFAFNRLLEVLSEERLGRDLEEASSFNQELADLRDFLEQIAKRSVSFEELGPKLDWRPLDFTEIRPHDTDLPGHFLSGFVCESKRRGYIRSGRDAARLALESDALHTAATSPLPRPALPLVN